MDFLKAIVVLGCLAIGISSCYPSSSKTDSKKTESKEEKDPFPIEPDKSQPGQQ